MIIHRVKSFFIQPRVMIFIVLLFIISSLAGQGFISFLFALAISLSLLSEWYLKYLHTKVDWQFKKYLDMTSIGEEFTGVLELKNESAFPIFGLKLNIESRSDQDFVFLDQANEKQESSIYSKRIDLLPHAATTVEIKMRGKGRGMHNWSAFDLLIQDPLKLQTARLDYSSTELPRFKVVPRIHKLKDMKLKSMLQGFKNTANSLFIDESNIIGTKDYENESFRHIHWLATAKENKLLAKKYQQVQGDFYSVFLNLAGNGPFHLRKDMEELIEYTVSVCIYLIKEGCKVQLWVNYSTRDKGILRLENDIDRSHLKKVIETMALINTNGMFLSTEQFYQFGMAQMDPKSMALVIGTPPLFVKREWLQIKQ
ncbi:DUF58 domain-containing protein [Bacillus salacetis]|uniref:DUF58 domain-containing protein n=1 Tax=Bacillus salacetis TaxID=2315464 RepID=A0A3A1QQJ1_9BACI|nr:DUF58 domain-containing protein [Bacillus salacetis]RIW28552.1 DUF58 domain-containing protein [Bacillus salacetis]